MVKRSEIGDLGGGSLEHPRQWLGTQLGPASSWECRADHSYQVHPEETQEASWGPAKEGTLTMRPRLD